VEAGIMCDDVMTEKELRKPPYDHDIMDEELPCGDPKQWRLYVMQRKGLSSNLNASWEV
jgi:hypothetical protein